MKPAPFKYLAPDTLAEALTAVQEHGYDAKLLAGGQSLIPVMNFRLAQPGVLIDINRIPGLDAIQGNGVSRGVLRLGAMARHRQLEHDPVVAALAPLIQQTMPFVAHPQIRNRGTLGGTLAHADPAAELPVVMTALQARFRLQKVGGERWVNADDFFIGLFATDLGVDEMIVEVEAPPLPPRTGCAFHEVARRHGDYALAGVAAVVTLDESGNCQSARLVYLNAGEGPVTAVKAAAMLTGETLTDDLIAEAAHVAANEEIAPESDIHATADFRRHLAKVLTQRALKEAGAKAAGKNQKAKR